MGNLCGSKDKDKTESKKSNNIDQRIREDQLEEENKAKLLLLGAGESGKSTIVKQMKIIHQQGFQDEERKKYVNTIHSNTLFCMTNLIKAMDKLGIDFENSSNKDFASEVHQSNNFIECYEKVKSLWEDGGIQEAFSRRNEFQLYDSAAFYFDNIDRIVDENFVPNDQDILMTRVRTTGIIETVFEYEGIHFTLCDVGGQRNERKKWIHCFQGVTAVIFCVSLSEYDQNLFEDSAKNRMSEAIMLFEEICNSRWFADTSIILFLNKTDLFRKKIKTVNLSVCFEDYDGGCDFDNASEYIKDKFVQLNRNPEKEIYPHFTCATDTDNIKFVFSAVKDIILQKNIKDIGMI
ncbi:guanine nucleotide-binding protein g(o) subunit alpha [Anaeramoeba flamelloides]|uniref:Guanine nucleotide-binding protein g(O) subunit alpha n=1 Tax=Anaeramoeba flamelloides TaxID=1746091 RepID=A0AAV7YQE2_9EUKA|nr:guanine nucleotide-binding protein g(o) subunit alpha [Anaeramoeba flamelloides]KAJ6240915.1 guanine nucleotide-binding protein g(o) subunit alpha [Anaeramoeba flamelloides]